LPPGSPQFGMIRTVIGPTARVAEGVIDTVAVLMTQLVPDPEIKIIPVIRVVVLGQHGHGSGRSNQTLKIKSP